MVNNNNNDHLLSLFPTTFHNQNQLSREFFICSYSKRLTSIFLNTAKKKEFQYNNKKQHTSIGKRISMKKVRKKSQSEIEMDKIAEYKKMVKMLMIFFIHSTI